MIIALLASLTLNALFIAVAAWLLLCDMPEAHDDILDGRGLAKRNGSEAPEGLTRRGDAA